MNGIQNFWRWVLRPTVTLWCKLTGRSNFALVRLFLPIGWLLMVLSLGQSLGNDPSAWNFAINGLLAPLWTWIFFRRYKFIDQLEAVAEKPSEVMNLDLGMLHSIGWDRVFFGWFVFLCIPGAFFLRPGSIAILIFNACNYWMFEFDAGSGKSVFAKAKDLTKKVAIKVADKVKDLVPEPAPTPIPALVGT
jgi:hypothetical protein